MRPTLRALFPLTFAVATISCGDAGPREGAASTASALGALATRSGVDYAWGRPGPGALTGGGYTFAARYLSYDTTGKNLTASEAQTLIAAGIDVVSNWEWGAQDALNGYNEGVQHAKDAQAQALAAGMPADRPIYFSVDFDATPGQQAAINSYFDGVASVIGVDRAGAYGGYYVIQRLFDAGKIKWGWQTYAWSGGQWDSRAQLRQVQNGVTIGGVDCDVDQAVADDFGQWGTAPPPVQLAVSPAFRRRVALDVNGDRIGDVCGRANDAVYCVVLDAKGTPTTIKGPAWSDASGWDQPQYGTTIRYGDVDGDGKSDVCGRANDGIHCELSDGTSFPTEVTGPPLSDATGWASQQYYSTIELADVNGDGKADVCARASDGVHCWLSDGHGFPTQIDGPPWSDPQGWAGVEYYSTMQLPDVNGDGKADLCARGFAGIHCFLSDGNGFPTAVEGPTLSDPTGWGAEQYYSTIQFPDVNGDGKSDVCARASDAIHCWLSNGSGFPTQVDGPPFSDANAWGNRQYYATIQYADADGDGKADLCARDSQAVGCWLSTGSGFTTYVAGPKWGDASGWNAPQYYTTIQFVDTDADGKADVCGRSSAGVECWLSDGAAFATQVPGPPWSDANGWGDARYFTSLHVLAGVPPVPPTNDGGVPSGDGGTRDGGKDAGGGGSSSGGSSGSSGGGSGSGGGADGGTNGDTPPAGASGGCSCDAAGGSRTPPFVALTLALAALLAARRRANGCASSSS